MAAEAITFSEIVYTAIVDLPGIETGATKDVEAVAAAVIVEGIEVEVVADIVGQEVRRKDGIDTETFIVLSLSPLLLCLLLTDTNCSNLYLQNATQTETA